MRFVVLLCGLAACDATFRLDHVMLPDDSETDALPACWDAALTENEDGDERLDGCDRCPGDAEVEPPPDLDRDGVGDACDPWPDVPGDAITEFDGFTAQGGWTSMGGSWQWPAGRLAQTDPTAGRALAEHVVPPTSRPSVQAALEFVSGAGSEAAGIWLMVGGVRVACSYRFGAGTDALEIQFDETFPADRAVIAGPGGTFRVHLRQNADGTFWCRGQWGIGAPVEVSSTTSVGVATTTSVGLVTRSSQTVLADWIAVYSAP